MKKNKKRSKPQGEGDKFKSQENTVESGSLNNAVIETDPTLAENVDSNEISLQESVIAVEDPSDINNETAENQDEQNEDKTELTYNDEAGTNTDVDTVADADDDAEDEDYDNSVLWNDMKSRLLSANPVFVKAIVIVPILGAAISLKTGILISAAMILTVIFLNIVMYSLSQFVPRKFHILSAFCASGVVVTLVCMLANYCAPSVAQTCGIYLPLLGVCALPMIETKHYGKKYGFGKTVLSAAFNSAGFAIAAVAFSLLREIIGNGTIYDRQLPGLSQAKFSFVLLPAGAFLMLGLLIALFRKIFGFSDDNGGK